MHRVYLSSMSTSFYASCTILYAWGRAQGAKLKERRGGIGKVEEKRKPEERKLVVEREA